MIRNQFVLDVNEELIVDNFAGGGGASTGIELALGRCVDIAINHDAQAVAMHSINHPQTKHYCESVWDINPLKVTQGRPVGLAWFSPDCKHFSKAKGGKPVSKHIRGLAWIMIRWALLVRPRVLILENVEEFKTWGPLTEAMMPCVDRRGETFDAFVDMLTTGVSSENPALAEAVDVLHLSERQRQQLIQGLRYVFEYRELRACDYGVPTIRKRLFGIGRCDGQPIVWPAPTHGAPDSEGVKSKALKPWRTAAECIDWSLTCPSIFERTRPLADATMKRIARGLKRYVIDAADPFIVTMAHGEGKPGRAQRWGSGVRSTDTPLPTVTASGGLGVATPYITKFRAGATGSAIDEPLHTITAGGKQARPGTGNAMGIVAPVLVNTANSKTTGRGPNAWDVEEPLRTVTSAPGFAVVSPLLVGAGGPEYAGKPKPTDQPFNTLTTENHTHLVSAFLAKHFGGNYDGAGVDLVDPLHTVTAVDHHALVSSHLAKLRNNQYGQDNRAPMPTLTAGGGHVAEVRAFLQKYYGNEKDGVDLHDPMHTVPTKDRFGLVTVAGTAYQIVDIGMRMLEPHELYAAQGFPKSYVIAPIINGKPLPKYAQVRMCGNSVCPPLAAAIVRANVPEMMAWAPKEMKAHKAAA